MRESAFCCCSWSVATVSTSLFICWAWRNALSSSDRRTVRMADKTTRLNPMLENKVKIKKAVSQSIVRTSTV